VIICASEDGWITETCQASERTRRTTHICCIRRYYINVKFWMLYYAVFWVVAHWNNWEKSIQALVSVSQRLTMGFYSSSVQGRPVGCATVFTFVHVHYLSTTTVLRMNVASTLTLPQSAESSPCVMRKTVWAECKASHALLLSCSQLQISDLWKPPVEV
jgi:hypothetical protein